MADVVYSKQNCLVFRKGGRIRLKRGAAWDADDPFVKANPEFFQDEPVTHSTRPVEDATAEPGRKRKVT